MEFIIYFTQRLFSKKYETGKLRILNHFLHKNMIKNTYLNFEKSVQSACIYKRNALGWGDFVCPVWGRYSIGGWSRAVKAEAAANLAQGCPWQRGIGRKRAQTFGLRKLRNMNFIGGQVLFNKTKLFLSKVMPSKSSRRILNGTYGGVRRSGAA